jgi:hypothetical protein
MFFRSKTPIQDDNGKTIGWRSHTYRRPQPKVNHQAEISERNRQRHAYLTYCGVPRTVNGQRLGLRKREQLFTTHPF